MLQRRRPLACPNSFKNPRCHPKSLLEDYLMYPHRIRRHRITILATINPRKVLLPLSQPQTPKPWIQQLQKSKSLLFLFCKNRYLKVNIPLAKGWIIITFLAIVFYRWKAQLKEQRKFLQDYQSRATLSPNIILMAKRRMWQSNNRKRLISWTLKAKRMQKLRF